MRVFNESIIEQFTNSCPEDVLNRASDFSVGFVSECIDELKQYIPVLNGEYSFKVVDENYFDCSTVSSDLSLFVVFKAPQLELNTLNLVNNRLKKFSIMLKNAWLSSRKPKKKKKRKKDAQQENEQKEIVVPKKYSMLNLKKDMIDKFVSKLDQESYIQVNEYGIKLISKKNFGLDINLYFVLEINDTFKLYSSFKNNFFDVKFKDREINFKRKYNKVGDNLIFMIRVFNNLYYTLYNCIPNQILMESLMYNVPDELFDGYSFYESFMKILNYLNNADIKSFVSITDLKTDFLKEPLITESPTIVSSFINNIEKNL